MDSSYSCFVILTWSLCFPVSQSQFGLYCKQTNIAGAGILWAVALLLFYWSHELTVISKKVLYCKSVQCISDSEQKRGAV